MDVACANSYIAYNMLHPDDITLLNFKIAIATHLIGPYTNRSRCHPENKAGTKRKYRYQFQPDDIPTHLPEFKSTRKRCTYCYTEGVDHKTFVECSTFGVPLCLVKDRNCFVKHHS